MEIEKSLYNEIKAYCDANGMKARAYIHDLLKKAFMEDKYGSAPPFMIKKNNDVPDEGMAAEENNSENVPIKKIEEGEHRNTVPEVEEKVIFVKKEEKAAENAPIKKVRTLNSK